MRGRDVLMVVPRKRNRNNATAPVDETDLLPGLEGMIKGVRIPISRVLAQHLSGRSKLNDPRTGPRGTYISRAIRAPAELDRGGEWKGSIVSQPERPNPMRHFGVGKCGTCETLLLGTSILSVLT